KDHFQEALNTLREFAQHSETRTASLREFQRLFHEKSEHPLAAATALHSLQQLRAPELIPELRILAGISSTAASDASPQRRTRQPWLAASAQELLIAWQDSELVPLLQHLAHQPRRRPEDRIAALEAMGRLGQREEAIPLLRGYFRYGRELRFRAGLAVTRLGASGAIPNLPDMIHGAGPADRAILAEAFWETGQRSQAIELWRRMTQRNQSSDSIRAALRGIQAHQVAELIPELQLHRASAYADLRRLATETLLQVAVTHRMEAILDNLVETAPEGSETLHL